MLNNTRPSQPETTKPSLYRTRGDSLTSDGGSPIGQDTARGSVALFVWRLWVEALLKGPGVDAHPNRVSVTALSPPTIGAHNAHGHAPDPSQGVRTHVGEILASVRMFDIS